MNFLVERCTFVRWSFNLTVSYLPVLIYIFAVVHIFSYCRELEDYKIREITRGDLNLFRDVSSFE